MQQDTFLGYIDTPISQNLYIYCYNSPLNYIDPSGNSPANSGLDFLSRGNSQQYITNPTKDSYLKFVMSETDGSTYIVRCGEEEITDFGTITYQGKVYDIYIPSYPPKATVEKPWTIVATHVETYTDVDPIAFFANFDLNEGTREPIYSASGQMVSNGVLPPMTTFINMAVGFYTAEKASENKIEVSFIFEEYGDDRRVIIEAGSTSRNKLYQDYADGFYYSVHGENFGNPYAQAVYNHYFSEEYSKLTGIKTNPQDIYTLQIRIDPKHQEDRYSSYLWINSNNQLMERPKTYEQDDAILGKADFLGIIDMDTAYHLPFASDIPVSSDFQARFDSFIKKYSQ